MKWWQDDRKAILRPEQRTAAAVWVVIALVGAALGVWNLFWEWVS